MHDKLRGYYERELAKLEDQFATFSNEHPRIAARLSFTGGQTDDPHVQRMMQAFALIAAEIRANLDDGAPKFTEALLHVLHPHYLRPFPACSIARFEPTRDLPDKPVVLPRGLELTSRGGEVRFRTAYDVTLAPIRIASARFSRSTVAPAHVTLPPNTTNIISITIESAATVPLGTVSPDVLRVHLTGARHTVVALLDTVLLHVRGAFVEADDSGRWIPISGIPITPAGFGPTDMLLPPSRTSPLIQPLLEHVGFPDKFDFLDIHLHRCLQPAQMNRARRVTLHLAIEGVHADSRIAQALAPLSADNLRLFCTPIVNLFTQTGIKSLRGEIVADYPLVPKPNRPAMRGIYSIDAIRDPSDGIVIPPLNAWKAGTGERFWLARHDPYAATHHPGCETSLVLLRANGTAAAKMPLQLNADLTCTNRDWPLRIRIGSPKSDLKNENDQVPCRITLLKQPTPTYSASREVEAQWRVIALTTANLTQLTREGWPDFVTLMRQLAPNDRRAEHVGAISFVKRNVVERLLAIKPHSALVRGFEIVMAADENAFIENSMGALILQLDLYLSRYAPANSFTQLVVLSKNDGSLNVRCPMRPGIAPQL
ncbi:TPA: type VI secretion system baseplate subunit TssF [Burkholderia aenigmatica]|uniref:type VI secretion system baseplate subunit TssF n=1 Tax=Burkholderia sp. AU45251 TaxID=3059204 RepID=UPI00264F77A0|nr:type VI secretion system baseplate subunit TssF [Burkholderia sp. AU45251]HDR9481193.1 type VI secretion system baseplate subunit TssF [Burkholderia aenigmatica]MDN7514187.1 type VI secretion system baseplate subunit TssF [Burkholderia sp. AU45251]HDR9512719.1 type VI secretion system baseplate subunit TssF [Burkholderia aenigmatica]HDR9592982.1 type VI secretion system baseplate subunit TssF [Burkholderia aenigmatica]HDR9601108.1 type VI secretion system baseplate subunit TssF [Burkholderi